MAKTKIPTRIAQLCVEGIKTVRECRDRKGQEKTQTNRREKKRDS